MNQMLLSRAPVARLDMASSDAHVLSLLMACARTHTQSAQSKQIMQNTQDPEPHTYLSCALCATPGTPAVVVWDDEGAADEPAATSGKCCLKLAIRSSPGFCELVLWVRRSSR